MPEYYYNGKLIKSVEQFLKDSNLNMYIDAFNQKGIKIHELNEIDIPDLINMKIDYSSYLDRDKFIQETNKIVEQSDMTAMIIDPSDNQGPTYSQRTNLEEAASNAASKAALLTEDSRLAAELGELYAKEAAKIAEQRKVALQVAEAADIDEAIKRSTQSSSAAQPRVVHLPPNRVHFPNCGPRPCQNPLGGGSKRRRRRRKTKRRKTKKSKKKRRTKRKRR
jgi:hypothetical protein